MPYVDYVPLLRLKGSSPLVELSDDVINGENPDNPGALPLSDVTIGDCASSSVSSNFLVGCPTQPRRRLLDAGNLDESFWNGDLTTSVRRDSEMLAAAAHFDEGESPATRCGYCTTPSFLAGDDAINAADMTLFPPFCCLCACKQPTKREREFICQAE